MTRSPVILELALSGASRMVMTDLPVKIPDLDACAACIAEKSVRLPHKDVDAQVSISNRSILT